MFSRRDLAVGVTAAVGTLGVVALVGQSGGMIGSSVYDWNTMTAKKSAIGEARQVMKGPTKTLDELEVHITTLNPGERSHPPHKHPNEEMIMIKEGTVETLSKGEWKRVGPGSVILNGSNDVHDLRNVGPSPATYFVMNWHTDKTPAGGTVVVGK